VSRTQHLDTGRAREFLGWQPSFSMEQAFEDYTRDLRAQMGRN
jgi:nucleoside-diphosphate-sugar epimerase